MAPGPVKAPKGPPQKHLHSRISYLYQAAVYLSGTTDKMHICSASSDKEEQTGNNRVATATMSEAASDQNLCLLSANEETSVVLEEHHVLEAGNSALSRQLLAHLRSVSLKAQIRLSPTMKHSICKRCDLLLVPGSSATVSIENKSRGGRKPWADVLVMTCTACGTAKRFPIGAKRQLRKEERRAQAGVEIVFTAAAK